MKDLGKNLIKFQGKRCKHERIRENRGRDRIHENDAYETLKEEKKRHGASKTAEELESYMYGLTCAVDVVEKYADKENVE